MKSVLFVLLMILLSVYVKAEIRINEIMFIPEDEKEWIELYYEGEGLFSVAGLKITDNMQTDEVDCCPSQLNCSKLVSNNTFFLILDQGATFNISENSVFFCVDDNFIGNGLGNTGDKLVLHTENTTYLDFFYNFSIKKGNTFSFFEEGWLESTPTPWGKNIKSEETEVSGVDLGLFFNHKENLYTKTKYDTFFKIINHNYPTYNEKINAVFNFNITYFNNNSNNDSNNVSFLFINDTTIDVSFNYYTTKTTENMFFDLSGEYIVCGEVFFEPDKNITNNKLCVLAEVLDIDTIPCNVSLSIQIPKTIYEEGEKIEYSFALSNTSFPFEIEYWIEDLYGESIKSKTKTTNINKKIFSPNQNNNIFFIKAEVSNLSCNNSNKNIFSDYLIIYKTKREIESKIDIKEISYSAKNSLGKAKLSIYKGNTTKKPISLYNESEGKKQSETSTIYLEENYQETEFFLPISFVCESNKNYFIVVEGLGIKTKKEIVVEGECGNKEKQTTSIPYDKKQYSLLDYTTNLSNSDTVFSILEIFNSDNIQHSYSLSSHLYKGNKKYSEEEKTEVQIGPVSSKIILINNKLIFFDQNNISLKIKIQREDRKTPYEITETVYVYSNPNEDSNKKTEQKTNSQIQKEHNLEKQENNTHSLNGNQITGEVVYSSKNQKIQTYFFYLVLFSTGIALFYIIKYQRVNLSKK